MMITELFERGVFVTTAEVGPPKHKITHPEEAAGFADLIAESLAVIDKY